MDAKIHAQRFQIRQCLNDECRFRYPAPDDDNRARHCPRCGAETMLAIPVDLSGGREPIAHRATRPAREIVVLLDNIRSAYNVGSIFRTADGAGIEHLYLCGITPTPDRPKVAKTALGAEQSVGWSVHANAVDTVVRLKQDGHPVWALEETDDALPLSAPPQIESARPVLLVLGNELIGIDPALLDLCDASLFIPMRGVKRSLNVATAFGIAAYALAGL